MGRISVALAAAVMRAAQHTPFKGLGDGFGPSDDQLSLSDPRERFRQAFHEITSLPELFRLFPELPDELKGKDILDFGSAYGGKTIEYARSARFAAGVEPIPRHIQFANEYAQYAQSANVEFRLCAQDHIPYPDETFDLVVSHDVIEHVDDPSVSLREIARVLRPGGKAYIAFPPYDGALSHHLDFLCNLPGIHWLFSAETLVQAGNREIARRGLHTKPQTAHHSWDGKRTILPRINGLTSADMGRIARELFGGVDLSRRPMGLNRGGLVATVRAVLVAAGKVSPWIEEACTTCLRCRLIKHHDICLSTLPSETNIAA